MAVRARARLTENGSCGLGLRPRGGGDSQAGLRRGWNPRVSESGGGVEWVGSGLAVPELVWRDISWWGGGMWERELCVCWRGETECYGADVGLTALGRIYWGPVQGDVSQYRSGGVGKEKGCRKRGPALHIMRPRGKVDAGGHAAGEC